MLWNIKAVLRKTRYMFLLLRARFKWDTERETESLHYSTYSSSKSPGKVERTGFVLGKNCILVLCWEKPSKCVEFFCFDKMKC